MELGAVRWSGRSLPAGWRLGDAKLARGLWPSQGREENSPRMVISPLLLPVCTPPRFPLLDTRSQ